MLTRPISIAIFLTVVIFLQNLDAGNLSGSVTTLEQNAIGEATVTLFNLTGTSVSIQKTDANGQFILQGIKPGEYLLQVSGAGFSAFSQKVLVVAEKDSEINIELSPFHVDETLNVTAEKIYELEQVPGSTAIIPESTIESSRAHNMKDVLNFTPGVLAQPRFGADESQFSIRGSGLRNNFHMRGINILVNGIPYQDADGFSDFETIDLMATQHIEIWKGAAAIRYGGNSMGGAINFVTNTGEGEPLLKVRANGGSFGFFKGQAASGGVHGPFDYYVSFSDTELEGYREHSDQGRQRLFGNFGWVLNDSTHLGFDVVYANVSEHLPGSLTREEFSEDPRQADPNNVENQWGRDYDYIRLSGRVLKQIHDDQDIEFIVFGQYRNMIHPIFQILDQDARNFGAEVRYKWNRPIGNMQNRLVVGFSPTGGENNERRFENIGGEEGNLTARFKARAKNYGFYFENQTDLTESLTLSAGGRFDSAHREFEDLFLGDGDRSDTRTYSAFSPKIGFLWKQSDTVVFGNVSRSYEPPLLLELTSFGSPEFLNLDAQNTWQFEIGSRGKLNNRATWDVAFYDAEIDNEIINVNIQPFPFAPFTIPSYRNADNTRHLGLEAGAVLSLQEGLLNPQDRVTLRTAYTYSRFRFVDDAKFGDNQIPGAPSHMLRAEVRYEKPEGLWVAPNIDWSPSSYFLDSANTVENENYFVLNLKAGYRWNSFNFYLEAANLADEIYSGSVQVDNAAGRFFEPSNGRSIYAGIQWEL